MVSLTDVAGDVLRVFLGGMFLWYGYFDVRPSEARKAEFRRWGFGPAVQPVGGVLQLASVALLVLPATVAYGALILFVMMVFSVYVHMAREFRPRLAPWPVVLAALTLVTAYLYGAEAVGPVGEVFRAWIG